MCYFFFTFSSVEGSPEANYTSLHGKARVVIENTFGRLKNRWCVNKDRTLHYSPEKCAKIIIACCVLHNIALKFGVPDPEEYDPAIEEDHAYQSAESIAGSNRSTGGDLIRGRALRRLLVDT